ncbi:transketolase [Sphaerobacter sp.]|uniref:transketolase n=1 Tax=Sphaerobacter sp. TaxID=2099654 RepID=UPI001DB24690|nr:transketolase [Sphaerobacter sp.]MBX5445408.1 transketolase [Sphaerobacter sp.]
MGDQHASAQAQPATANLDELRDLARRLRREVLIMTTEAGSGHPSSSFSAVEILTQLYFGGILRYNPQQPHWPDRDRFILSKGHAAPILYAVLAEAGYFPKDELKTLRKLGSPLEGHPNMRRLPGVEASTGSLGQGLSIGLGHALAARLDGRDYQVYVMLGDGEIEEGQVWEAAMAAANQKVGNLIAIVDNNRYQQTSAVSKVTDPALYDDKWAAFGWKVLEIDGHDLEQVRDALIAARDEKSGPVVIIAHTIKGKGLKIFEEDYTWHGRALPKDKLAEALEELG